MLPLHHRASMEAGLDACRGVNYRIRRRRVEGAGATGRALLPGDGMVALTINDFPHALCNCKRNQAISSTVEPSKGVK